MNALGKWSIASLLMHLLTAVWCVLALVLVISVGLMAASPFIDLSGAELGIPVSFRIDASHPVAAPSLGIEAAQLRDARGTLIVSPRDGTDVVGPMLVVVGMLAFGLWVVGELRAVFRTLSDGRPFAAANAARIRRVAWAVMLCEPVRALVFYSAGSMAAAHFTSPGLRFEASPDFEVLAIVNGLILLVVAEVFRAGTRLDEDQSLTV